MFSGSRFLTIAGSLFLGLVILCVHAGAVSSNANPMTTGSEFLSGSRHEPTAGTSTNWPMFKNQISRLGFNPLETTINPNNAQFLALSWVGIMGDLVDYSSPAVVEGVVYVGSIDGNLYAFDANGCGQSTCNPLWVGTMNSEYYTLSSPAVVNGTVFIGSEDHKLYAFAAKGCGRGTCLPLWTGVTGGAVFSSPVVANNVVYVGSEDHRLYAFSANGCGGRPTCPPLWMANTNGPIDSSPAIDNGVVYVGSQDGKLYAFRANGCGGLFCHPNWTGQVGQTIFGSTPALANGVAYIASFEEDSSGVSKLYAFRANGCGIPVCKPLWTADAGEFVQSSPAVANGRVYIGSGDDLLYAFDANGCNQLTCAALWRGQAVGAQAALISSPTVANGLVYVGRTMGWWRSLTLTDAMTPSACRSRNFVSTTSPLCLRRQLS